MLKHVAQDVRKNWRPSLHTANSIHFQFSGIIGFKRLCVDVTRCHKL